MSSEAPAISVHGLTKSYHLDLNAHRTRRRSVEKAFYALRDVTFDAAQGDVLGLIGSNGAGKSTLLKILSRITSPDSGTLKVRGRVGSLLEVGTGFHPELTGRENVFLNGSILGMSRKEIARQYDAIVDFSEIESFLETPVKRYSSGMYVRLAFAVASHLTTEVLVVDEVLAVGDGAFQSKCMAKMESLASEQGRTILLVTHNLTPVRRLCNRVVYLQKGMVRHVGDVNVGIAQYLEDSGALLDDSDHGALDLRPRVNLQPYDLLLTGLTLRDEHGGPTRVLWTGEPASLEVQTTGLSAFPAATLSLRISTAGDDMGAATFVHRPEPVRDDGPRNWRLDLPRLDLAPGDYQIGVGVLAGPGGHVLDSVQGVLRFRVLSREMESSEWKRLRGDGVALLSSSWEPVLQDGDDRVLR